MKHECTQSSRPETGGYHALYGGPRPSFVWLRPGIEGSVPVAMLSRSSLATIAVVLLVLAPLGAAAHAGDYDLETEPPFRLRGLLDVRLVLPGRATAWTDRGPGKARFGGDLDNGRFEHVTDVDLAQLALELSATLPGEITARAQLDLETSADIEWRPLLVNAYFRREWGRPAQGFGLQAGVMNLPFSLEHTGPAWTPAYTLTPSALCTWLWEEGRLTGLEGEVWHAGPFGFRLDMTGGFGFGADQSGILLAQRGWVLSDYLTGVNASLPLPAAGKTTSVFDERDHRPAAYLWLSAEDPWKLGSLGMGYFDNFGETSREGVWHTRFGTVGVELHPVSHLDVLAQYLEGDTERGGLADDSRFQAAYFLLSMHLGGHRVSVRYDDFRVHDTDGPPDTTEHGSAVTVAYLFELGIHHRFGVEYVIIDSRHPALFSGDPPDDGWQFSYRFRF